MAKKIVLLHGNRQTGQLLLGRLNKLQKRLQKELQIEVLAPDAPFPAEGDTSDEHSVYLTWWHRVGNDYQGLDQTLNLLRSLPWNSEEIIGIMGFSQGARLTHLLARLHQENPSLWFPNLQFVILAAGYDAPLPTHNFQLSTTDPPPLEISSLHIWGEQDPLIFPTQSEAVTREYDNPQKYIHPGKHFVPSKAHDINKYVEFIQGAVSSAVADNNVSNTQDPELTVKLRVPDAESADLQRDEIQALEAIFPDEIKLISASTDLDGEISYKHPIVYHVKLLPNDEDHVSNETTRWPVHPLTLKVQYPYNYPLEAIPEFQLLHENNSYEFPSKRVDKMMNTLRESCEMELGMPSVLSGLYAVKEFLDAAPSADDEVGVNPITTKNHSSAEVSNFEPESSTLEESRLIQKSTMEAIQTANLEGLDIAEMILRNNVFQSLNGVGVSASNSNGGSYGNYVIGLVGKPSAGKSTFFNAASAFSRQRKVSGEDNNEDSEWGGASMAAHPFTTIDPNIGYCLIPAPKGACPEDGTPDPLEYASTHGRSPDGRRFLPVLLKDVAGLVPGAYQGKGRGNQFLNDLTDSAVLIHVVDASGTADASGNKTVTDSEVSELTNPLDDLAWIRNELVEWIYSNLTAKWDGVQRRGRERLAKMFSGYGQRNAETQVILIEVEKYMEKHYRRVNALESLTSWDEADVHRLVSAFLGVRFPMALALNKIDLPSSKEYVKMIQDSLPIHGAHVGTPMAAHEEMLFVRNYLKNENPSKSNGAASPPSNVWRCLTSALSLRPPVLVFPVSDMSTYAPFPGLNKVAAENASLPSGGMIRCIKASGGALPPCWDASAAVYTVPSKEKSNKQRLRDVLVMKPGSTVEDVFFALKKLGALGGEFVRAEASADIGDKPKPVPKLEIMGRRNRIIKIISNKRSAWQS